MKYRLTQSHSCEMCGQDFYTYGPFRTFKEAQKRAEQLAGQPLEWTLDTARLVIPGEAEASDPIYWYRIDEVDE